MTDSILGILGTPYPTRYRQLPNVRTIEVVEAPTIEPVTVADAKAHSRIVDTAQDALIGAYVAAARQYVEAVTGIALVLQTWRVSFDFFETPLKLPGGKIASLDTLEYTDADGNVQTIVATGYSLDPTKGRLYPPLNACWPTAAAIPGAVRATYKVGAEVTGTAPNQTVVIDPRAKASILLIAADLFENREASGQAANVVENPAVDRLLFGLLPHTV